MKHLILTIFALCSLGASAQGVAIFGTDGSRMEIPHSQISSIEFYETAPLPLTQPDDVETVDLGLSVAWASCNVGAQRAEDSGAYFAWGETSEKQDYSWQTYFDVDCSSVQTGICGRAEYDPASAAWGGAWRLPTLAEMQELCDRCTWEWVEDGDIRGCRVTGPSGASIFLPACGTRQGSGLYLGGSFGGYLTGAIDADNAYYARSLVFYREASHWIDAHLRDYGQSVRAVKK